MIGEEEFDPTSFAQHSWRDFVDPQVTEPQYVGSDLFPSRQVAAAYERWVKGFDPGSKYARWVDIADGNPEVAARAFVAGIKYANERQVDDAGGAV